MSTPIHRGETMTADSIQTVLSGTAWRLDPGLSAAEFRARTFWGLTTVRGRFARLDGTIDPSGRMFLEIEASGLDTGNRQRDRHLRSATFFDCERHPLITFTSPGADFGDEQAVRVPGELQVAGRTIRLDLEPTVERRGSRLVIDATATVDQRELGMTYRRLGIRVGAVLTVHAELEPESD
jgi:polyisoprenoid-binding protein YceI